MTPSCEHKRETLVHGLETLLKAETQLPRSRSYYGDGGVFQLLRAFQDHEADEVGLWDEVQDMTLRLTEENRGKTVEQRELHDLKVKFIDRALAALIECECGRVARRRERGEDRGEAGYAAQTVEKESDANRGFRVQASQG